jgi:hypothetical protein
MAAVAVRDKDRVSKHAVCNRAETRRRTRRTSQTNTNVAASRLHGRHTKQINLPMALALTCSGLKPDDVRSYLLPLVSNLDSNDVLLSKHAMETKYVQCDVLSGGNAYTTD